MLNKLIHRFLLSRHYWRHVGFDELSELYVSNMFRSLALSLTGIMVPLFLLELKYGIRQILLFYAVFFTARVVMDLLAGYVVAYWGPKHTIIFSHLLQIVTSMLFVLLPSGRISYLVVGVVWALANSLFFVAFHVDFSKVKHQEHGGKELGWLNCVERLGQALGPVMGGAVATLFDARYTFVFAMGILATALIPLLRTREPLRTKQQLHFRGLGRKRLHRDMIAYSSLAVENTISTVIWPLFMGVFILTGLVYVKMGALASASMIMSMLTVLTVGKIVDDHQGRKLLHISAIANGIVHFFRPFVSSLTAAFGLNLVNEVVTAGYRLPFHKGWYDAADEVPAQRIEYVVVLEMAGDVCKASACWGLVLLTYYANAHQVFTVAFVAAALASYLITVERFPALNPRRHHFRIPFLSRN